ncbi:ammonium transporter 1 member 3-like, partial [Pecten maximus]|uniref:ammonium transporter 1 member 3-like n=1 Tax=Pecten maximus TaxID=6579 RepID=UPI0014588F9D
MSISTDINGTMNMTEMLVQIAEMKISQAKLIHWQEYTNANLDQFFRIGLAIMVFLMQGGFAMLEVGCVRSKNATNILIKNLLDACEYPKTSNHFSKSPKEGFY